ncbi:MAG TPA: GNAT family protein [Myxococcota bacterium]|nr:GNAT family protein [Myxococcota bacterium]
MKLEPIVLEGSAVRLEPLSMSHHAALCGVSLGGELFRFFPFRMKTPDDLRGYIEAALRQQALGTALPFVTRERISGAVVGSTSYLAIEHAHRRLEIGATWLAPKWQGTALNTEAKLLLVSHAIERLGMNRVEFKTDARNGRSRAALLRIGAIEEGTFRSHMVMPDGHLRDSVYYSIVARDWPETKLRLEERLAAGAR